MTTRSLCTALSLLAVVATASSCDKGTLACRDKTLFVTLDLTALDASDRVEVGVVTSSGEKTFTVTLPASTTRGTVEITFPGGYPVGENITLRATASAGGTITGTGSTGLTVPAGCATATVTLDRTPPCMPMAQCPSTVVCGRISDGCNGMLDCGPCQLTAIDHPIASAGDTLTLEGKFAAPMTVSFPGGATATATVLGANRATVIVPPLATEGLLSVTAAGSTPPSLPFRRATFAISVGNFRTAYEQAEVAQQLGPLPSANFWMATVATTRWVWLFGGNAKADSIVAARVNADGAIGGLKELSTKMTTTREGAAALRIGDFVYVIGGRKSGEPIASAERAPINADGTLGAFAVVAGSTLKASVTIGPKTYTGRVFHPAHIIGDSVYVVGGTTGPTCTPTDLASVERARILPNGDLGDFQPVTATLTTARTRHTGVVHGQTLYVVSGDGTMAGTSVDRSPIDGNGDLMGFVADATPLPTAASAAYVIGGALTLIPRRDGAVVKSTLGADGSLGAFTTTTSMIQTNSGGYGHAIIGNYLYVFGGGDTQCCGACFITTSKEVQRAPLANGGGLGTFSSLNNVNLVASRDVYSSAVIGDKLWVFGGHTDPARVDVESAKLDAGGTLAPFVAEPTVTLKTRRSGAAVAVLGDFVYLLGGSGAGNTALTSVEVAPINPDGTLGVFGDAKVNGTGAVIALATARSFAFAAVLPGDTAQNLCVVGGGATRVQCAPINADGTLGATFANTASTDLQGGGEVYGGLTLNSSLYAAMAASGRFQAAPFDANGALTGTFALGATYPNPPAGRVALTSTGARLFVTGGNGNFPNTVARQVAQAALPAMGALPNLSDAGVALGFGHTNHRGFILGSRLYVVGGLTNTGPAPTEVSELR